MATRFCVICGTEVDEQATFCPACGNPMDAPPAEIPAAPAWPRAAEPEPAPVRQVSEADDAPDNAARPGPADEPARPAQPPQLPPRDAPAAPAAAAPDDAPRSAAAQFDLPITWPVTLSGWLIGVGSFVGALAVLLDFRAFTNPVTLIAFLLLLAVAASVFFSANLPAIPHKQLWILVIVLVAFGAALERIGDGTAFAGIVFFLATGAAAAGAVILELGLDRPLGGTRG